MNQEGSSSDEEVPAAGLGPASAALRRAEQLPPPSRQRATADAVIVLWMAGGMAQTETFDPKRYTPFAPGVAIKDVLSRKL